MIPTAPLLPLSLCVCGVCVYDMMGKTDSSYQTSLEKNVKKVIWWKLKFLQNQHFLGLNYVL